MISGTHVMIYSQDAEADRAFLRDVLEIPCIDSGGGWLIYRLPPTELGVHPGERNDVHEFYLMCDDLDDTLERLRNKGVTPGSVATQEWGRSAAIPLPGGGQLGHYEAYHARP